MTCSPHHAADCRCRGRRSRQLRDALAPLGQGLAQPVNAVSGRQYRGVNVLLLWATAERQGFRSGRWATFRQWTDAGAQVRKRERGTAIFFWKSSALGGDDDDTEGARLDRATSPGSIGSSTKRRWMVPHRPCRSQVCHLKSASQLRKPSLRQRARRSVTAATKPVSSPQATRSVCPSSSNSGAPRPIMRSRAMN